MTTGFAAKVDGKVSVRTVSETEIAAMVNYLYIYRGCVVYNDWSDEEVTDKFEELRKEDEIVAVTILEGVLQ